MNVIKLSLAAAGLLACCLSAQANTYDLGAIASPGSQAFGLGADFGAPGASVSGAFSDVVQFTIDGPQSEAAMLASPIKTSDIPDFAVSLSGGSYSDVDFGSSLMWFGTLDPGVTYSLHVTGTAHPGASYSFTAQLQPVPEPQQYALMLAGAAVVGLVARRRQRAN